jgi:hypothetical protein
MRKDTSIKSIEILANLSIIVVLESILFNIMHLVYIGFMRDLCKLLNSKYFKNHECDMNDQTSMSSKS